MRNISGLIENQIQVGEVKNPKGRPKGSPNRGAQIKRLLAAKSEEYNPITKSKEKLTQEQWCIIGMIGAARKGNVRAFEVLMDGKYGPLLKLYNSGELENPESNGAGDNFITYEIVDPQFDLVNEVEIGAGKH